jgi:hypothetical protein
MARHLELGNSADLTSALSAMIGAVASAQGKPGAEPAAVQTPLSRARSAAAKVSCNPQGAYRAHRRHSYRP